MQLCSPFTIKFDQPNFILDTHTAQVEREIVCKRGRDTHTTLLLHCSIFFFPIQKVSEIERGRIAENDTDRQREREKERQTERERERITSLK